MKERFVQQVNEAGLENIEIYPLQPVELVPDVYSAGDVCIIPLRHSVIYNGVPSKAPILMACNRVIVNSVDLDSHYARMFIENDMGVCVNIGDYDLLAEKIKQLYHSPQERGRMSQNAKEYCTKHFSSDVNTRKYMDIFDEIGKKK